MDLDNRWERVKLAYDLLVKGEGKAVDCIQKGIEASYEANVTDEFLKPIYKDGGDGKAIARIEDGDAVICFNFRTDRGREITRALTQEDRSEEHTSELQSIMRNSYAVFCLQKKNNKTNNYMRQD